MIDLGMRCSEKLMHLFRGFASVFDVCGNKKQSSLTIRLSSTSSSTFLHFSVFFFGFLASKNPKLTSRTVAGAFFGHSLLTRGTLVCLGFLASIRVHSFGQRPPRRFHGHGPSPRHGTAHRHAVDHP